MVDEAPLLGASMFTPVIAAAYPMSEYDATFLLNALTRFEQSNVQSFLILNPRGNPTPVPPERIADFFTQHCAGLRHLGVAVHANAGMRLEDVMQLLGKVPKRAVAVVHSGFSDPTALASMLRRTHPECTHIFELRVVGRLYRRPFNFGRHVLLRDGRKPIVFSGGGEIQFDNATESEFEFFSDLHATFEDEGADGFGDWLNVGDVITNDELPFQWERTICLTRFEPCHQGAMYLYHFRSNRKRGLQKPLEGAFDAFALSPLGAPLRDSPSRAIWELSRLYWKSRIMSEEIRRFAVAHHLQMMASYFQDKGQSLCIAA